MTSKEVLLVCKGSLDRLPGVMSLSRYIADAGARLTVLVSTCSADVRGYLEGVGVKVVQTQPGSKSPRGRIATAAYWLAFRRRAWAEIRGMDRAILWVASGDTALALGPRLLRRAYILHLRELYDALPYYRCNLARYARAARVVVCAEACRAAITRFWYDLPRTPFVIYNKPQDHPRTRQVPITDSRARRCIEELASNERLVLYQGVIHPERDLDAVAESIDELGEGWRFVVMGWSFHGYAARLQQRYRRLVYIPEVVAPRHLEVTSWAHIGAVSYRYTSLNTVFCAPNKIWEYAGFGIPMLCNDVPGLMHTVGAAGAGPCVDFGDLPSVVEALQTLDREFDRYSAAASRMYEAGDPLPIVRDVLAHATASSSPEGVTS